MFAASNSNGLNIFDVDAAVLSQNLNLVGLGSQGTVVVNVHGSFVDFGSHGFDGFSSASDRVLFNLVDATSFSAGSVYGSILAPNATFQSSGGGVINGQVIVQSWNSSVQVNNVPFAGKLPVAAVPEPESYAMLLAGLGLMATIARRRRAKD